MMNLQDKNDVIVGNFLFPNESTFTVNGEENRQIFFIGQTRIHTG